MFVGVNAFDTKSAARAYLERYGVDYANIRDGVGTTFGRWGVTGRAGDVLRRPPRARRAAAHHRAGVARRRSNEGIRQALKS